MERKLNSKIEEANCQKSTRKKWSIQDEPHSLLKRLRSQLAEDGCSESQLMMAKTLLQLTEGNLLENQQQAVYWLIQSSLQGDLEATEELENCFKSGRGICEKNFQDVKTCLTMDLQVKLAAVAARRVFQRLCEGNGFISEKDLVMELWCYEKDMSVSDTSEQFGCQRINEKSLLKASQEYTEGKLPTLINDQQLCSSNSRTNILTIYLFLLQALLAPFHAFYSIRPIAYVLLVGVFLSPLTALIIDEIVFCFVHLIWLCASACIVYSLVNILLLKEQFKMFGMWGKLLHRHCLQLDCLAADSNFNSRYFPLFAIYCFSAVLAVAFNLIIYNKAVIIFIMPLSLVSCLAIISILRVSKFHGLSLFLFALIIHPDYAFRLASNCLSVFDLTKTGEIDGLYFMFKSNYFFLLVWFLSLLLLYWNTSFMDVALQLALVYSCKLVLGWVSVVKFNHYVTACGLLWVCFLFHKIRRHLFRVVAGFLIFLVLFLNNYSHVVCYSFSLCVVIIIYILMAISPKCGYLFNTLTIVLVLISFIYDNYGRISVSELDWEYYKNSCLPRREASLNLIHDCSSLAGVVVQWEGVVKTVEVSSVTNRVEDFILFFPAVIQDSMRCMFGNYERPTFLNSMVQGCSTHYLNSYTYDITILMERPFWKLGSSEICLRADANFKQIASLLTSGDSIQFIGMLYKGLGTELPIIKILEISCLKCNYHSEINSLPVTGYISILYNSTKIVYQQFFKNTELSSSNIYNVFK